MRDAMRTPRRLVLLSAARFVDMLAMPFSGSLVMQSVAVSVGAASKPGVDTGTGKMARPPPGTVRSLPVMTTSWQRAVLTSTGGIGLAIAFIQAALISSTAQPIPTE